MAKDYAKKKAGKKRSGASRGNNNQSVSTGLILTAVLLAAALIAFLVYLKWYQSPAKTDKTITEIKPKTTKPIKTNEPVNKQDPVNIEDDEVPFYKTHEEILNKTVEIPIEDLKLPEDQNKYNYLMPCGSFRESSRAEELKAQIAMAGYESNVNQVTVESGLWHRVELGPFKSKRKAESIRHRLQDNGFNYCKIWPKKIK